MPLQNQTINIKDTKMKQAANKIPDTIPPILSNIHDLRTRARKNIEHGAVTNG